MKKWLWPLTILLMLACGAAFADSAHPTITSNAVADKTDISIAFLSSIFGTVSGVLTGTSGQMFGKLMYQFNQGMLVLAGCWLLYSVLSIALKTGLTGSFMSQEYKVPMVLLRIAIGFGMLIPNPSTGYTVLQGIVMQVTVQGVKLADQVWEYGLDYIKSGGALWSRPVQKQADGGSNTTNADAIMSDSDLNLVLGSPSTMPTGLPDNFGSFSMVQKIMAMEACMVQSSINLDANNQSLSDNDGVSSQTSSIPLSVYENTQKNQFEFPAGYATGYGPNSGNNGCGVMSWQYLVSEDADCSATGPGGTTDNTDCGYSHLALRETIDSLLPAVKRYVCLTTSNADQSSVCNGVTSEDADPSYMSDGLMNATLSYKNLIDPVVRSHALAATSALVTGGDNALNFYSQARKEGWMSAGRYYWDLMRVEDAYDTAVARNGNYSSYIPAAKGYIAPGDAATAGAKPTQANLANVSTLITLTTGDNGYIAQTKSAINQYTGAASSGNAAMAATSGLASSFGVAKVALAFIPLTALISDLIEIIMSFGSYAGGIGLGADPILWIHKLGLTCISLGFNIWFGFALGFTALIFATKICSAVQPAGDAFQSLGAWLRPFILAISGGLILVGFSLGYYLPLYPYMLFTFGTIGWLISVIEAMVAAPLVAVGVTHPDGHDFVGKSTHAVMMLVGLFIRPVLMLIGLFASMILCQVSMSIILYTFSGFVTDLFYFIHPISGQTTGDPVLQATGKLMFNVLAEGRGAGIGMLFTSIIAFPLFLAVFTMLVYTTTVTCFSLIHHLPDYVMLWIGGPQSHGANAQQMAEQVKQSFSGVTGKLGEAMGHSKAYKPTTAIVDAEGGNSPDATAAKAGKQLDAAGKAT